MAVVPNAIRDVHEYLFVNLSDPRTFNYPLISSPWPVLAIIAIYLYFCLRLGPAYMKNRPPMQLNKLLVAFDVFQIAFSAVLFSITIWRYTTGDISIMCHPLDMTESFVAQVEYNAVYAYFICKLIDFLDTVFIILRKKENQISFLHLYHHAGIAFISWAASKYFPGGQGFTLGLLNTFVHTVMYTYYLFSTLGYKNLTRYKRCVTLLQMTQFVLLLSHGIQLFLFQSCSYPINIYAGLVIPQYGVMLYLFYQFYRKAYGPKNRIAAQNGTSVNEDAKVTDNRTAKTNGLVNGHYEPLESKKVN